MIECNGQQIETDPQGYLQNVDDWQEALVPILAKQENIELTPAHWEVIYFVRDFYLQYKVSPAVRLLVKAMAEAHGPEKGSSQYLFTLFREGPAKQATKLAGLPKPVKCL